MTFRRRCLLLLCGLCLAPPLGAEILSMAQLIATLRSEGYSILYSDSLLDETQEVRVAAPPTIDTLEAALTSQKLGLRRVDDTWLIVRIEDLSAEEKTRGVFAPPVLETVIVTGSRYFLPASSSTGYARRLEFDQISDTPTLASDPLRAALRLPGMSSLGVSARPHIRGGLQDEMLFLRDGVELLEPFHLADYHSPYSAIDSYGIEAVDVYTGGFPSRYGNRMSGVMDVRNDLGHGEHDVRLGLSSFSNFLSLRREFGDERPGIVYLGARQGDLSDLTGYLQTRSGSPRYDDLSIGLDIRPREQSRWIFGAATASDHVRFDDSEESASVDVDTRSLWVERRVASAADRGSRIALSWLDLERGKRLRSFEEGEEKGGFLDHEQSVQRFSLRHDLSLLRQGVFYELGWQLDYGSADYRHRSRIDRGELADIVDTERQITRDIAVSPRGWSGGIYLQGEWQWSPRILVQPSVRWDAQDYNVDDDFAQQLSPRIGIAAELSEALRLRLGAGRFHQPEGIQELQVLDGVTRYFPAQYADQWHAAIEWSDPGLSATAEFYEKRYGDLKGRFENMFNPFVLLPEMEPDRVALQPSRARARGVDLELEARWSPSTQGFFRYSWMDARDRVDGHWVPRRWSQEHTINTGISWSSDPWTVSLALGWHSGWRSSRLPAFIPEDTVVPVAEVLNNTELSPHFSADLAVRYRRNFGRFALTLFADISNLSDRSNNAGIDFDIEEVDAPPGFEVEPDQETLLGRVPSIGLILAF